ncbi:dihydrofolate reductase family protein [Virgibacillus sp. C22-A2]|uniref:Dihydrofolate reductase family protein n=1 Tax=Virgibacillus tibetensis TaxID=3042313 RepID=A0ABU6KJI0_9BACI|nr:dihydrofolate reductase family protein [Virgibacillus sp. C22-A2]
MLVGKVILDISMSLDGFIAGPNDNQKQGLGEGGETLHDWLFSGDIPSKFNTFFKLSSTNRKMFDEASESTGAMVVGRRTFDLVNGWGGSHPIPGVPVFVVTHSVPEKIMEGSTQFTFVTDGISSAIKKAKLAAGTKNVSVGTANVAQQCIKANLVDEILIHLVPVLLGRGIRLFDHIGTEKIQLEKIKVTEVSDVTHLRYRILK